jgi:hypothetical protein
LKRNLQFSGLFKKAICERKCPTSNEDADAEGPGDRLGGNTDPDIAYSVLPRDHHRLGKPTWVVGMGCTGMGPGGNLATHEKPIPVVQVLMGFTPDNMKNITTTRLSFTK